jgi:hypothetical protein
MKKISRNIFLLIIVLIFFLGLSPRFFILDEVHKTVTEHISRSLDSSVTIKKMHWVWLPLPHLTLVNTNVSDGHYDLFVPKTKIYPTWRLILGETHQPGKIILDSPQFHINKKAYLPRQKAERSLPEVAITFKKGEMEIESSDEYRDILRKGSVTFSEISGTLKLNPLEAEIDLQASSPFSKKISLQGNLNIPERDYSFTLDLQDIKLHQTVKSFFKGRLIPVESPARLTGAVVGKGLQHIKGDLDGTLPYFVVKPEDREILLTSGFADLEFLKSGSLLRLDINDLEIKDPQVNLSGHIERKFPPQDLEKQPPIPEPIWTLDIVGSDLDVTGIREKVLTLWAENKIVKTVSNIVLEGKALSASYHFSGPAADFKSLGAMNIEVDVLSAALHVPGVELDLTNASGPIQIKDSILTGHSLGAQLSNSYGSNAELFLDLGNLGDAFKLDIDIDADLTDLPPVLKKLVNHEGFQRELLKFSGISGRAFGTAHLGDTLDNIITRVDVKKMQFVSRYEPVPKNISIDSGALHVEPEKVSWKKVKGNIGQQEIISTSGNVSWQDKDTLLHIEEIQAQLEGASLHAMLKQTEVMPQKVNNVLSSLNGKIEISSGSLQGPILKPESWEYDLAINASGFSLTSPLLPEPAGTEKLTAVINHNEVNLHDTEIRFLDQTFRLKGLLKHHLLENWHGMIVYNGPVLAKLASWVSSKGWFPEKLRPQIPCTMEDISVTWQGETVAVTGSILHGLGGGRLPLAKIDFENTPEHLRIKELTFYAPGEQGRLELDFWRISPHSLILSWEGFVNADTIDALFKHSSFTTGIFSGDFKINYLADQPEKTRFEGLLNAENLHLKTSSSEEPIVISRFNMLGMGRQLRIPTFDVAIGPEKITGMGQLAAEKDGLQLDISLSSSYLSKKSLTNLSLAMQETHNVFLQDHTDHKPGLQLARGWDITGRVGFDFDSFALRRKTTTPYDEEQFITYTFYDVHGDMQLAPDRISRTEIFSAKLCTLDFKGSWFSDANLGQKFQLHTNPDESFRLENVLPCLGVKQDVIEGDFTLQANLLNESDIWYGGDIHIKSSQGRILRLKTLSRIFKVVNITDLFEEQLESTGKRGFPFSQMDIDTHIKANNLIFDRAIIRGEGLNLFARGEVHLDDYDADMTLLIAPFKTFDTMVSKVPIIGQPVTGADGSMVSIPVAIKGPVADPNITPLHPEALGDAVFNILKGTFMLPYNIFNPQEKPEKENSGEQESGK